MSLVTVSSSVKRAINLSAVLVIFVLILYILSPAARVAYRLIFPPKDLPNLAFGRLDKLSFLSKDVKATRVIYTLNTKTGNLPGNLPNKMTVYEYILPGLSFNAGRKAQTDAERLGYFAKDLITDLKGNNYAWRNSTYGGVLEIEINEGVIKLNTPMNRLSEQYPAGRLNPTSSKEQAKDLFADLGRFQDPTYVEGEQVVVLGKWRASELVETISTLEAQIARVDFFRELNGYPVLGPDAKKGMLHVYLKQEDRGDPALNYPKVEAYYWEINQESSATYPIITVAQAWEQVKQGKGVISNVTSRTQSPFQLYEDVQVDEIIVNEIYLAYYDNISPQRHIQPVYVFDGIYSATRGEPGNITLYYPAIPAEYIQGTPQNTDGEVSPQE